MTGQRSRADAERLVNRFVLPVVAGSALLLVAGLGCFLVWPEWRAGQLLNSAGLIALMTAPVLRVGIAVVEALRKRDWFFVTTTFAVAFLLALTVVFALVRLSAG